MRKYVVFIALLLSWGGAAWADAVLRTDNGMLRLSDTPCVNEGILSQIQPQWKDKFRRANAVVNGKAFEACWIGEAQGGVFVLFEDGDEGRFAWKQFKPEPGV